MLQVAKKMKVPSCAMLSLTSEILTDEKQLIGHCSLHYVCKKYARFLEDALMLVCKRR